ncbi:MarR family transcriptional regulator [Sphingomonas sp. IC081]|uniref:MarR family transcriptional regulator n=1 Tax=Sphingomonas sp. IC081 TaxID=304378 RepID=UPI001159E881|nr:MarR family transcriptional regulator [Sphingomonas sp. IC081]QDK31535.1 MarR family transcriptional regulator [Sphingomonas sp. IC081]
MDDTDFTLGGPVTDDFAYGGGSASGQGSGLSVSIFADRAHVRAGMREDAGAAGLRVTATSLAELLEQGERPLGDVVLLDCPQVDGAALAALSRLDMRAPQLGARLIVSTSVEALDDVFACMDHSNPLLLVDPSRAERVVALGRVLATMSQGRVRELSDDDRLMILRLTEQVGEIAGRIDRLAPSGGGGDGALEPAIPLAREAPPRCAAAQLPDARLVRKILRQRQLRARFIEGDLFADPAWDMLLDLAAAQGEGKQVSVTSLCIAAAVPPTTALRWIGQMVDGGLFRRVLDDNDRRRAFIELTDKAVEGLGRYFGEIGLAAPAPV